MMTTNQHIDPHPTIAQENLNVGEIEARFREGLVLHRQGLLVQAKKIYQEVLEQQPQHAEALHLLGVIAAQSGDPRQAVDFMSKSIERNPNNAMAHTNLGNSLSDLGQYQAAVDSYSKAIAINPDYVNAYRNRGNALNALQKHRAAIASYDKAIAINPDIAETYYLRGNALLASLQHQAAVESYRHAIAIKKDHADTYLNLGIALASLGQHRAAVENFDKAISIQPSHSGAYANRGSALMEMTCYQTAADSYEKAFTIRPDIDFLYGLLLSAKMQICAWHHVGNQDFDLVRRIQCGEKVTTPFPFLAQSTSLPLQRQAAEIWVREKAPGTLELGPIAKHGRSKKILIGYFSMDFGNHPIAHLATGLFESHDRDKFEVYAFSYGPDVKNEMRARLEAAFDKFLDVRDKSDREIAELARLMKIDIAIDLAGHTAHARTGIFALRTAPVQINYLGYPGTMGAEYMDYLIADKTLIPEASQHHYSEKIAYLPSFQANDSKRKVSDKVFTRAELGLPETGFVFCCFNNNYKMTASTFDGWMRILKQVAGSVLFLYAENDSAAINLRVEASRRGVVIDRLVFGKKLPVSEYLARYRVADLFLDTFPFNAGTTASDALWVGLPVLTFTGEAFASRMAASLLTAIDLPELITSTQEEYEALAVQLALNPERLQVIKQKLDRNRLTTPLFDTKQFTQHIEDAYTQMVERYHAGLPPQDIFVGQ